jgi:hypothetical protein
VRVDSDSEFHGLQLIAHKSAQGSRKWESFAEICLKDKA